MGSRETITATVLLFLIAVVACWILAGHPFSAPDFTAYVRISREFLLNGNPYSVNLSSNPAYRFYGPPYVFATLFWFGFLSPDYAGYCFALIFPLSVALLGGMLSSVYLSDLHLRLSRLLLLLFVIAPFGIMYHGVLWGTLSWIPLTGISLFLVFWRARKPLLSGLACYFCILRPHQLILLGMYLLFYMYRKRTRDLFAAVTMTALCSLALVYYLNPGVFGFYTQTSELSAKFTFASVTAASVLWADFHTSGRTLIAISSGLIFGCVLLFRRTFYEDPIEAIPILVPLSLLFGPYAWFHDYLLCLPTQFFCARVLCLGARAGEKASVRVLVASLLIANIAQLVCAVTAGSRELYASYYIGSSLLSVFPLLISIHQKHRFVD